MDEGATRSKDDILGALQARVPLLAHTTPLDFEANVRALAASLRAGETLEPSLSYAGSWAPASLLEQLDEAARDWDHEGELGALYADKAREVALEAQICAARGTPAVRVLARSRFGVGPDATVESDRLASSWIDSARDDARVGTHQGELVVSDDATDDRSLVSRMRAEVGRRRLPFRVFVVETLAPLAAVGDGVIQIAPGRRLSVEDVERTVRHEIEGHVEPSVRARGRSPRLYALGTARGSDHQEGWALVVEERAGFLGSKRKIELGLRHAASRAAHEGVAAAEIARDLARRSGLFDVVARSVCRAYRGGGLGREAAYLPSYLAVTRALDEDPALEAWLTRGRVSLDAARVLRALKS